MRFLQGCPQLKDLTAILLWFTDFQLAADYLNGMEELLPRLINTKLKGSYVPLEAVHHARNITTKLDHTDYARVPVFENMTTADISFEYVGRDKILSWFTQFLNNSAMLTDITLRIESKWVGNWKYSNPRVVRQLVLEALHLHLLK
uniref:Uncharacterized protein n=1 Tax=Trifolium medium TaxID=97028 RepID=A0A392M7J1_9FABA